MKKALATILVLCMVLGFSNIGFAAEEAPAEHVDITLGIWDAMDFGTDELAQYLIDKFNFNITIRNQDWNTYEETIKLWASADDLPDVWCGYVDQAWFVDFIDEELLRDIPIEMLQKYPRLYELWENEPLSQALYDYYGKIYYFPRLDSVTVPLEGAYSQGAAIYYRKDWAEKLGKSEPTDVDELLDLLIAYAQEDPDGNGQADTYGLSITHGTANMRMVGLYSWFNAYPNYWIEKDGQYTLGYLDKEPMVDALTWLRKAYENGGLDPEFAGEIAGFSGGIFGAYAYLANPGWMDGIVNGTFGTANPELGDAMDVVGQLTALPRHAGEEATVRPYFADTMTVFSYHTSDAVVDRMLSLIDWIAEGEGLITLMYGFEGETYEVDENGKFIRLTDTFMADHPSSWLQGLPSWGMDREFDPQNRYVDFNYVKNYNGDPQRVIDWGWTAINRINAASHNPRITFALIPSILSTPEKAAFMFDKDAGLVAIISGTEDVETMYDAFVKEAYDYGAQDVIDSVNAAFNK